MLESIRWTACSLLLVAVFPANARAQGEITDGGVRWAWTDTGTVPFSNFRVANNADHLYQQWWWYRIQGEAMETRFRWPPASQSGNPHFEETRRRSLARLRTAGRSF